MKCWSIVAGTLLVYASCGMAQSALHLKAAVARRPGLRTPGTHHIVQFREYPGAAARAEIARRGLRVLEYVPDNALLVAGPSTALADLDAAWAGELDPTSKISPELANQSAGALLVEFYGDVDMERARATVTGLGFVAVENASVLAHHLAVLGPYSRIEELATRDDVKYILPAPPELAAGEPMAGCTGALTEAGPIGDYALVGQGWPKDAGGTVALKYFVRSL